MLFFLEIQGLSIGRVRRISLLVFSLFVLALLYIIGNVDVVDSKSYGSITYSLDGDRANGSNYQYLGN